MFVNGDAFDYIQTVAPKTFNTVITSPPYYQQRDDSEFGNEATVEEYIEKMVGMMSHLATAITDDGNILINMGDKRLQGSITLIPYQFALAVQSRLGLHLKNEITWHKTNPSPMASSHQLVVGKEPVFHFAKSKDPYTDIESYRDELSAKRQKKDRSKSKVGQTYFSQIESSELTPEEKAVARHELQDAIDMVKRGEITGIRMKIRGIHALPYGGQAGGRMAHMTKKGFTIIYLHDKAQVSDVISTPVASVKGSPHRAMFPKDLIKPLIALTTPPDGIVFDPFMGTGTTAIACEEMGRAWSGCEINPVYYSYALKQIEKASE